MKHTYTFDNSNNIVKYGFDLIKPQATSISIEEILNNTSDGIIVFDTRNIVFNKLISKGSYFLNDTLKKFIGVVDAQTLQGLSKKGLKSGFIRSTKEDSKLAVIIADKSRVYLVVDEEHIFEAKSSVSSEIFNYINHIIWSKTDFEVIQGSEPSLVNSIRLSVVKPDFDKVKHLNDLKDLSFNESTSEFKGSELLVNLLKDSTKITHQIIKGIESVGITQKEMYLNPFEDYYVPTNNSESIYLAHSFSNVSLKSLLNKKVWIDGKEQPIDSNRVVSEVIYKPVDEYRNFKPDFNQFTSEMNDKFVCSIKVDIDVKPMTIDKSYSISKRYEKIKNVTAQIQTKLEDLKKLIADEKENKAIHKQVEKVEKERNLSDKVKFYNQLIGDIKIGDDALLNKKDKRYQLISVSEKEILVPSDLVGKLYEKQNILFFGIKTEERIADAQKWLKDNKETATLVLMDE